jgi:hypothetical protein
MTALSVTVMLISGIFAPGFYTLPAFSGVVLAVICLEIGLKWSLISFSATSILSLLLSPNKEAPLMFIMFFGYYPIFKIYLDKIKSKILKLCGKIFIFNVASVLEFFITTKLLSIPEETYNFFGAYTPLALLLLGNIVFLIYDRAVFNLIAIYLFKFSEKIKNLMNL